MGKRLVLAGYFGRGNLGDDAILLGFTRALGGFGYEYRSLCASPEKLMRDYGINGVLYKDLKAVGEAIKEADALVFPGGSVFQDATSFKSVAYYANLVKMAKKENKKVVMLGQGVGPLTSFLGKRTAVPAFNAADIITVRDRASAAELKNLGVKGIVKVTADTAFLLGQPPANEDQGQFGVAGMKSVGVSARPVPGEKSKQVVTVFAKLLRLLFENGWMPSMIEMDQELDRPLNDLIGKEHGGRVMDLRKMSGPIQLQQRIARMDAVIAMRLHAGILATTVGVPSYMVSYDPKVNAFVNAMGMPAPQDIRNTTAERIFDGFQTMMKDREALVTKIRAKNDEFKRQASESIDVLVSTVGR